jgi:hypothetical protein
MLEARTVSLLGASATVCSSEKKGRHVIATADLNSGEHLLSCYPRAWAVMHNYKKRVCARCLRTLPRRPPTAKEHGEPQAHSSTNTPPTREEVESDRSLECLAGAAAKLSLQASQAVAPAEHDGTTDTTAPTGSEDADALEPPETPESMATGAASSTGVLPFSCEGCRQSYYCSSDCQSRDAPRHSPLICPAHRYFASSKVDRDSTNLLFLLVCFLNDILLGCMDSAFQQSPFDDALVMAPGKETLESLQSHRAEWTDDDVTHWRRVLKPLMAFLGPANPIWSKETESLRRDLTSPQWLEESLSRIESNCFGLFDEKDALLARVVYPEASFFNHCESTPENEDRNGSSF